MGKEGGSLVVKILPHGELLTLSGRNLVHASDFRHII